MNTCRNCTFWNNDDTYNCRGNLLQCTNEKLREGIEDAKLDELCYAYYEGGGFYTGPDFGCVHWEKINSKTACRT